MTPVLGCETARELLEPFVDGELSMPQQVAVQAHVRSCEVCAARLEDLALIGWSVRAGIPAVQPQAEDTSALAIVQSGVLTRIRAERSQSLSNRLSEMFADMRLLWPAMGASLAVVICLCGTSSVWSLMMQRHPESLAGRLDSMASRGTDSNPLPLDDDMLGPHTLEELVAAGGLVETDTLLRIVVATSGEVTWAEMNMPAGADAPTGRERVVLNGVRQQRFAPAVGRTGRPVAVEAVLFYTHVTAEPARLLDMPLPRTPAIQSDSTKTTPPAVPAGVQSALVPASAAV